MKNLESIAEDLFNKIRGRFPSVTIGSAEGKVTNVPKEARYFDFEYKEGDRVLGKVSISLDEDNIAVMYSDDFVANEDVMTRNHWYNFLKELRQFSKKRLLNFDTRNITKSNSDRRDYKFLAKTRAGDNNMNESTMYGTSRTSYQNIGNARVSIKHSQPVDQANPADRTRHVDAVYIESSNGERFKYPYKHLTGARAMARHVAEGGTPYDDFGSHIVNMSEELSKLRKFKTYVNRSSVMAEGLVGYMDAISERMDTLRKSLKGLQRENFYKETFGSFEKPVVEEVPSDVAENWIDQLTIRQFNEELKDVFPFVYKVVSEYTKAKELSPQDLEEFDVRVRRHAPYFTTMVNGKPHLKVDATNTMPILPTSKWAKITPDIEKRANTQGFSKAEAEHNNEPFELLMSGEKAFVSADTYKKLTGTAGAISTNPIPTEQTIESALDELMGQFSDHVCEDCGNPSWRTLDEEKQKGVDGKVCWKGYRRQGTKMKGGRRVDNCVKVKENDLEGDSKAEDIRAWAKKYSRYKGGNGDPLPMGWVKMQLDTGVPSDAYENNEYEAAMEKFGADAVDNEEPEIMAAMPITLAMIHDLAKIFSGPVGEDEAKIVNQILNTEMEGNPYAYAVRQAKMAGKKKGDTVPHPNGEEEITLEKKTPLGEFILSYFDYTTGQFPKGETAVLTMIEKDYGEQYITPAKQFIERINNRVAEVMGYRDSEVEESGLQYYIGKKKYGKDGMKKLARAGRDGASQEELGRIKDQYEKESAELRKLAGL